ncbi:hypothetical protein DFH07DRAFT_970268 [Mycena maculata]|uniref:Uncharacterized protein n=1 Tax=Mycena maculata TaxID=230809 RepID=A0AAD7HS47_9AGAR|nr:hypothetical protein DFH07DRAFT_970268 [Mycena maculata]
MPYSSSPTPNACISQTRLHLAQKIERVMETFAIAYDRRLITSPPLATWVSAPPWPLEIRVLSRPVNDHPPNLFSFPSRQERDLALKVLDTPPMHHYVKCLVARIHSLPQQESLYTDHIQSDPNWALTYPTLDLLIWTTSQELHKNKTDRNCKSACQLPHLAPPPQQPPEASPPTFEASPRSIKTSVSFETTGATGD